MADKIAGRESQTTTARRLKLHADYGRAVMWSKGFAAEETEAAFARASDLSLQTESRAERSTVHYARWIRSLVRSEMNSARMIAESFLREAEAEGRRGDAALARRTVGSTCLFQGELALARSHTERALAAESLHEFAREHDIALYAAWGENWLIWARGRLQDPQKGARELRHALSAYMEQGNKIFAPHYYGLIAELEVMTDRADTALVSVDAGLALAEETGERWTDPLLFRLKGEIILKRDRANLASAEKAFATAVAIAKAQGARSFGLQAALSLAKLYQSINRPADARVVLTPALEGFAPTPEMPEIAEAHALMDRLV